MKNAKNDERNYVTRSMPICLSTAHLKVLDSSKRFELMLFSGGKNCPKKETVQRKMNHSS